MKGRCHGFSGGSPAARGCSIEGGREVLLGGVPLMGGAAK